MKEPVLVTGAAGFIGMHVAHRLLGQGHDVVGVDNLNAYYDPHLKQARIKNLEAFSKFKFERIDIAERQSITQLFAAHRFPAVVHLAAQAGVRHSLIDPHAYVDANITGFLNVLEGCRHAECRHLVYASSSSVYGATKRANELMAHAYAHLFALPATGLRFFTVYGPWGCPDMAMWLFTEAILENRPIKLFNNGHMRRDFTYVDDAVEAVVRLVRCPPAPNPARSQNDPATSLAPWRVYNVGNSKPVEVTEVVRLIEEALGKPAVRELLPMQPGDVPQTCADAADLERAVGFRPDTPIGEGIRRFVDWFLQFRRKA